MDRIALSNAAFEGDNNASLFADGRLVDGIGAELDSRDDGRWPLER